jgi:sulfite reductase (NADPH) hemoprotein beta-component
MPDPAAPKPPSKVEDVKVASNYLRGTLAASLEDRSTGAIADDDTTVSKFHGIYQQDHRDQRNERKKAGLEKAFIFMIRIRVPGGVCTPEQWL